MKNYKGNMLLVELVIVILFFSVSSSIVLQVFARAQQINTHSQIVNHAMLDAENAAESLYAASDADQALIALGYALDDGVYRYASQEGYEISARLSELDGLTRTELTALYGEEELFRLPVAMLAGGGAQ